MSARLSKFIPNIFTTLKIMFVMSITTENAKQNFFVTTYNDQIKTFQPSYKINFVKVFTIKMFYSTLF